MKESKGRMLVSVFGFIGGLAVTLGMLYSNAAEGEERIKLYLALFVITTALITVFSTQAVYLMQPYFTRRAAARRALGKHSIAKIMRDKTARMAYKGILALFSENTAKAEEYLNAALNRADIRENQLFCVQWLLHVYEAREDDEKQLWCMRRAVELVPENPEVQAQLGRAYFVRGQLDKARYCFEQAIRYDPNNGYCYYSIARIHMLREEYAEAEQVLQTLLKINENHPLVYAEYSELRAIQGDRHGAEEYYRKALLCGFKEAKELNERITQTLEFGGLIATEPDGQDIEDIDGKSETKSEGGADNAGNE